MTTTRNNLIRSIVACSACVALLGTAIALPAIARQKDRRPRDPGAPPTVLKEAKLNIEHNATDHDTGFQGAVDSEGWQQLELIGPNGPVLQFEGKGELGELGLTELFFETVEPENADTPIAELLADLPAGTYTFRGRGMIEGERTGEVTGTALLTHNIPAGPALLTPTGGATVPADELQIRWGAVTQTLGGGPVNIVAYQLIVEKDVAPHRHMIGKWGLSMYLPATVTSMTLPRGFLEPGTAYKWEVLAIEESGNQTLSSSDFRTY